MHPPSGDRPSGSNLPGSQPGGLGFRGWEADDTAGRPTGPPESLTDAAPEDPSEGPPGDPREDPSGDPPEDRVALGPDADTEQVARKILLDQLTGQARSRAELAEKLRKKSVPPEVGEPLLDRFEEVGLVDDEAFARLWVQSRQSGKGLARRALAQELRRKGVDDETARTVLEDVDPDDEEAAARMLVRRKLRSVQRLDRATAVRRLAGMLARKGYSGGLAFQVVREELDAVGHDSDGGDDDGGEPCHS